MIKKIYYTWEQVEGACLDLCRQIVQDKWYPQYIVGISRGGLVPANLISQYLDIPMATLMVSLRDGGYCVSDTGMAEDAYNGTNILVVDDINDQGSTIEWIKKDWQTSCLPGNTSIWDHVWGNNVRFAVLTNNLASNSDADYNHWDVNKAEEDCWLVYPWEEYWK
jgi:hypothetical protein